MTVITPEIRAEIETRAKITGHRLGVLAHAREVLDRAVSECNAWTGAWTLAGIITAMRDLDRALASWDTVATEQDKTAAINAISDATREVLAAVKDVMGSEAAQFVAEGKDWWEE